MRYSPDYRGMIEEKVRPAWCLCVSMHDCYSFFGKRLLGIRVLVWLAGHACVRLRVGTHELGYLGYDGTVREKRKERAVMPCSLWPAGTR